MQQQTGLSGHTPPEVLKRRKTWVIGLTVTLLMTACVLGIGHAMFDLFKSDRIVYLEAERKGWEELFRSLSEAVDAYQKQLDPYLQTPYHHQAEVSQIQLEGESSGPYADQILNLLKEASILIDTRGDETSRTVHTKVALSVDGNSLIGFEAFADSDKLGFGVPDIYGKYAVIHWKDSDAIRDKYQLHLPKRLITRRDVVEAVKLNREEILPLLREYGKLYADSITDQQVSIKSNAVFEPTNQTSREITVTFTESQFKQLVKRFAEQLAADEKLQEILYTRYRNVRTLLADSGYDEASEDVSQEAFTRAFRDAAQRMAASVEQVSLPDGVQMVLFVDARDRILGRTISFQPGESDRLYTIKTGNWTSDGNEQTRQASFAESRGDAVLRELALHYTRLSRAETDKGSLLLTGGGQDPAASSFQLGVEWEAAEDGDKTTATYSVRYQAEENGATEGLTLRIAGTSVKRSSNLREGEYEVTLQWEGPANAAVTPSLGFRLRLSEEWGRNFAIPPVTSASAIDLATVSEQEMLQVEADVQAGFQQFVRDRLELFQQFGIVP